MPMLRYGNVWQIWHFGVSYYFSTSVSNFASTGLRRWQTLSLCTFITTNKYLYPLLLFPTFLPQAYSPFEHSRQTEKIPHPLFPKSLWSSVGAAASLVAAATAWGERGFGGGGSAAAAVAVAVQWWQRGSGGGSAAGVLFDIMVDQET
jgi:hypothetical protein